MEFSFLRESPLFISMFSDILYEGNKAGTVRLAMSRETVKQELIYGILQTVFLTVFMIVAITVTSLIITRKYITTPLLKLQESASSIAKGNLDTLIDKSSNDEIGVLAQQFDKMRESVKTLFLEVSENKSKIEEYSRTLEQKVDQRTVELEQSVDELQALGEVSRVVNSTLDLNMVLTSIMHHAVQLSNTKGGTIFEFEESEQVFVPKTYYGISNRLTQKIKRSVLRIGDKTALGQAGLTKSPVQISDLTNEPDYPLPYVLEDGFCALLAVPLMHENRLIGGLVVLRENAGNFAGRTVELLQMFAAQSALAMYNAQLFTQVEEKSSQLELADKHKSEFLANMSHELRTPLNAILGYTDLILDEIYGDVPEKIGNVLVRVEKNGRHLLNLINDILDISKIEAGRLTLSLDDYSFGELVNTVLVSVEGLAADKGLELAATVDNDLPVGRADQQRIAQVLVNLLGNAIKFTDEGEVEIVVGTRNNSFLVSVLDTGVGLSAEDRKIVFEGFRQVDGSSTRERGGTGLGLAIVKKIVEMHGGRIWVESRSEGGANFSFSIPVRVEQQVGPQWEN
jgi:signal transduction histidine kinase/HAMP domain-containing protein